MSDEQNVVDGAEYKVAMVTNTLLDLRELDGDDRIEEVTRLRQEMLNGMMLNNDIRDPKMLGVMNQFMTGITNSEFRKKTLKQDDDNTKADLMIRRAMMIVQSKPNKGGDLPPPIPAVRTAEFLTLDITSKDIDIPEGVLIVGDDIQTTADQRGGSD